MYSKCVFLMIVSVCLLTLAPRVAIPFNDHPMKLAVVGYRVRTVLSHCRTISTPSRRRSPGAGQSPSKNKPGKAI
jgi:hypothetical protein